jgi:hypothetical protein
VNVDELITEIESAGGMLILEGERVRYKVPFELTPLITNLRAHKAEVVDILRQRQGVRAIPAGAILLARRYDGGGKPLASVPKCWCCEAPYKLEGLQKSRGKTYALLEPGCGCLDTSMCYQCFVCRAHCRCVSMTDMGTAPKTSQRVFRTPTADGDPE